MPSSSSLILQPQNVSRDESRYGKKGEDGEGKLQSIRTIGKMQVSAIRGKKEIKSSERMHRTKLGCLKSTLVGWN